MTAVELQAEPHAPAGQNSRFTGRIKLSVDREIEQFRVANGCTRFLPDSPKDAHWIFLAAVENLKDLVDIGFVVHNVASNLHPSVRLEGEKLCADDHLSVPSVTSKKEDRGGGTLQTQYGFEIKDTGEVYRM